MFEVDSPIKKIKDDKLNRSDYCKALASAILNYPHKDSFVIGLYGKWGYGKSSVINMTIEHLKNGFNKKSNDKLIIIEFQAWSFSNQNQLVFQFFKKLIYQIHELNLKSNEKVENLLIKYLKYILPLTHSNQSENSNEELLSMLESSINYPSSELKKESTFEVIKERIDELLIKLEKKIVIIIDDIDRLTYDEINQIFQMVKSIGNFSNTIYFLSFDKSVVINALDKVQENYGERYLEKIIQFPIELPILTESELNDLFNQRLEAIISKIDRENWNYNRMGKAYKGGIDFFIKSVRDIIRFSNTFQFQLSVTMRDVNIIDLMILTIIQIFSSKVYDVIRESKDFFTGGMISKYSFLLDETDIKQQKINYEEIINQVDKSLRKPIDKLLRILFPIINKISDNTSYSEEEVKNWKRENRVCIDESFDLYFKLTIPMDFISQQYALDVLNKQDFEEFQNKIRELIENGNAVSFLNRIIDLDIDQFPANKTEKFIKTLFQFGDLFSKDLYGNIAVNTTIYDKIYFITDNLLKVSLTQNQRFNILNNAILGSDNSLFTYVYFLSNLEYFENSKENKNLKDKEKLLGNLRSSKITQAVVSKIKDWAKTDKLFLQYNFAYILYRWKKWEHKDELSDFIHTQINSDKSLIRFISKFLYTITIFDRSDLDEYGAVKFNLHYNDLIKFIGNPDVIIGRVINIKENNYDQYDFLQKKAMLLFIDYYYGKIFER
jgi:predicted KAP-like P-loop ATPase